MKYVRTGCCNIELKNFHMKVVLIFFIIIIFCSTGVSANDKIAKKCKFYDQFNTKGNETPVTRNCDTFDFDLGGWRPFLAQYNSGLQIMALNTFSKDLLNKEAKSQSYVGENPTFTQTLAFLATHNLDWYGLNSGSQIALTINENYNTYKQTGRDGLYINRLSVYLPFMNNHVFVQAGYYQVANMFYGQIIGTNAGTNALGPQSSMLFQTGVQGFRPTTSIDVKVVAGDERFYNHFGVFRSISANGALYDARENYYGLATGVSGGGAAFIDEIGFRTEATSDAKKIWLRAGAIYNTSPYRVIGTSNRNDENYAFYIVGDLQITQSNQMAPPLGWYINGRYNAGNDNVNYYSSDASVTLYKFGTFADRPSDIFSVSFSHTNVGGSAQRSIASRGITPTKAVDSYAVSYGYKLYQGLYFQPGITYTTNPTLDSKKPAALNFSATLAFLL